MIAFIKHAEQRGAARRCTAVPLLLPPYVGLKAWLSLFAGWVVMFRCSPPPLSPLSPLFFCADEMKDDFDTLGPDAALQAVGNGTGEFCFLPPLHLTGDHWRERICRR